MTAATQRSAGTEARARRATSEPTRVPAGDPSTPTADPSSTPSSAPRPASASSPAASTNPTAAMANDGHMPCSSSRSTTRAASSAPRAMPTDEPVNCQAKTRRRSCDPVQRRTSTDWAGCAAVIPMPNSNMAARKVAGEPASSRPRLATAATVLAATATRTGGSRSARRPPTGAARSAPTEKRLDAPAATSVPHPRVFAA